MLCKKLLLFEPIGDLDQKGESLSDTPCVTKLTAALFVSDESAEGAKTNGGPRASRNKWVLVNLKLCTCVTLCQNRTFLNFPGWRRYKPWKTSWPTNQIISDDQTRQRRGNNSFPQRSHHQWKPEENGRYSVILSRPLTNAPHSWPPWMAKRTSHFLPPDQHPWWMERMSWAQNSNSFTEVKSTIYLMHFRVTVQYELNNSAFNLS